MGTYNIYIYAYIQKWLSINCILFERSIFLCYVTLPECYLRNSQALFVPSDYSKTPPQKPKGRTPACRRFAVRLGAYDIIGSQEKTRDEIQQVSRHTPQVTLRATESHSVARPSQQSFVTSFNWGSTELLKAGKHKAFEWSSHETPEQTIADLKTWHILPAKQRSNESQWIKNFPQQPIEFSMVYVPLPLPPRTFWLKNKRPAKTQRFFHRLHRPIRFIKGREVGPPRNYTLQDLAYGKMLYGDGNDHFVETYDFSPFCRGTFKGNVLYIYISMCVCDMLHLRKLTCHIQKGPKRSGSSSNHHFSKTMFILWDCIWHILHIYMTNLMMGKGQLTFPT